MRRAIYAGSFDPITHGHLSVVRRAAEMFDELHVVVAVNPEKEYLFDLDERVGIAREAIGNFANVRVVGTRDLVIQYARDVGASFLVRGVRSSTDVEAEISLANMNHTLAPEIATVFVPALPGLSEVSSSRLKEMVKDGLDVSPYCSQAVATKLKARLFGVPSGASKAVCHAQF